MSDLNSPGTKAFFDGVSFLANYPLLSKATASDEALPTGFILNEIARITFESETHRQHILDFLLNRLSSNSPHTRLKTLKILQHVSKNGHCDFSQLLRKKDGAVKDAGDYTSPADGFSNQELYLNIKKEADSLLLYIFNSTLEDGANNESFNHDESGLPRQQDKAGMQLSGMGNTVTASGKYQGFGNAPVQASKTMTELVVDSLTDVVDKLSKTPDSINDTIHKSLISEAGSYLPVKVASQSNVLASTSTSTTVKKNLHPNLGAASRRKQRRSHTPGKAGGGWEEDESAYADEDDSGCPDHRTSKSSQRSFMSTDSLERLEMPSPADWEGEERLITDCLGSIKTDVPSRGDIRDMFEKFSRLNCDKILDIISTKLSSLDQRGKMTLLLFVEAIYRNKAVLPELALTTLENSLKSIRDDDDENHSIRIKSEKILLILERDVQALRIDSPVPAPSPDSALNPSPLADSEMSNDKNDVERYDSDTPPQGINVETSKQDESSFDDIAEEIAIEEQQPNDE